MHDNELALKGSGNTFWHPLMMPRGEKSSHLSHPPTVEDDSLFSMCLHPPMIVPDESGSHMDSGLHIDLIHQPKYSSLHSGPDLYNMSRRASS